MQLNHTTELINFLAHYERTYGCLVCILPGEYEKFIEQLANICINNSPILAQKELQEFHSANRS